MTLSDKESKLRIKKRNSQFKIKNPDYQKNWEHDNQQYRSKYKKKYREEHKEEIALYKREYEKNNPEKRLEWTNNFREKHGMEHNMSGEEYKLSLMAWSRTVKKRDGYKCTDCDSIENLHAHHILPKSQYPEFTFLPMNGMTECHDCHWDIHRGQS